MSMPILPANLSIPSIAAPSLIPTQPSASEGGFQSAFAEAVQKVDSYQQSANTSIDRFLSGEGEELHHVAITAQQADISFQLFMQVRNKVVAAYSQVMSMQV
jgi:flagellar hook-basal body complex protein FliE